MSLSFVRHLKNEVKKEVKMKIFRHKFNQNELDQFSETDLKKAKWKDEKEFSLKGDLYDVVKTKLKNGQKIYYCFHDKKETKIADLENKIQDFFSNKLLKKTEVKSYFTISIKINNVSGKVENSFSHLSKKHFLKTQFQSYQLSIKSSDFIDKVLIPPEV